MEARVIKAYIDKKTEKNHKVGSTVELTKERFEELRLRGFVTSVHAGDKAEVDALRKENTELLNKVKALTEQVASLTEENTLLKAQRETGADTEPPKEKA